MATFKDLIVWQKSHLLVLKIYEITKQFPREEIYGLTNQIRRAAYSVPANIVEGKKKKTIPHQLSFINIAEGSLEEVKYFLILSKDLKYIEEDRYNELLKDAEEIGKLLNGYERFIKNSNS
ncbi:four helix bundle protein [Paenimyroides tangerinum]|uniref:Four helix bundle protein n=1 Tax=Paenimyroides tangerinum TaxID=2488728 RepID=A0A3P3WGH7_9FLAO|nr:four helix bundle protein [Paenimyroides tangerinum]RRJ92699.1 four helix bundle protein [Paenimyroides tangerinum]